MSLYRVLITVLNSNISFFYIVERMPSFFQLLRVLLSDGLIKGFLSETHIFIFLSCFFLLKEDNNNNNSNNNNNIQVIRFLET